MVMDIRDGIDSDLDDILAIHGAAFNNEEEPGLVRDLLGDPSAKPVFSLLAFEGGRAVGHILFTRVGLGETADDRAMSILAPLALIPEFQKQGVGGKLVTRGLEVLAESGVELVFVLGHPEYYPRYGFKPAGVQGFEAPYPIPEEHAGAWMVQALRPGVIGTVRGKVVCADALDKPEYWRE
jgi:putative acetyltransferase